MARTAAGGNRAARPSVGTPGRPDARGRDRPASLAGDSPYGRAWTAIATLAAVAWAAVAVVQSPPAPLLLLVAALGCVGGLLVSRAPWSSATALRRYVHGALVTAACVLATVGVGHHLEAGLATVAVLLPTAPPVLRWVVRE